MAILAGVTQLNKSRVSDVMSNKILKECKKKQSGSRKAANCKSFEALFEVFYSDRESITLLNFLSLRVKLSKFRLLSGSWR